MKRINPGILIALSLAFFLLALVDSLSRPILIRSLATGAAGLLFLVILLLRYKGPRLMPGFLLGIAVVSSVLGSVQILLAARIRRDRPAIVRVGMENTAVRVQADFSKAAEAFKDEVLQLASFADFQSALTREDPDALFAALKKFPGFVEGRDSAVVITGQDRPLAWRGATHAPEEAAPGEPSFLRVLKARNGVFLCLVLPLGGATRLVAERRLADAVLLPPDGPAGDVQWQDFLEDRDAVARFFEKWSDRYWRPAQGRVGVNLVFPVRLPRGDIAAVVTLTGNPARREIERLKVLFVSVKVLLLLLAFGVLYFACVRRFCRLAAARPVRGRAAAGWLLASILALVVARLYLSIRDFPGSFFQLPAFQPTFFALRSVFGIFGSPADLLVTSSFAFLAAGGVAMLALYGCNGLGYEPVKRRKAGGLALAVLAAGAAAAVSVRLFFAFENLVRETVENSNLDLNSFSPYPGPPYRLMVLFGLYFLFGAYLLAAFAMLFSSAAKLLACFRRRLPGVVLALCAWAAGAAGGVVLVEAMIRGAAAGREPFPLAHAGVFAALLAVFLVLVLLVATGRNGWLERASFSRRMLYIYPAFIFSSAVLYASIAHDFRAGERNFIEKNVADQIRKQDDEKIFNLQTLLDELQKNLIFRSSGREMEDIAYTIWEKSFLSQSGYSSSVILYGEEGEVISSFSFNLPVQLEPREPPPGPGAETGIVKEELHLGSMRIPVFRGERPVSYDGNRPGLLVIRIGAGYGDYPFLFEGAAVAKLLHHAEKPGPPGPAPTGYILNIFDPTGRNLYNSRKPVLPLVSDAYRSLEKGGPPYWEANVDSGSRYAGFVFEHDHKIYKVSYREMTTRDYVTQGVNLFVLGFLFFVVAQLLMAATYLPSPALPRPGEVVTLRVITGSFSRKLFLAFLLIAVLPIFFFTLFLKSYVEGVKLEDMKSSSLASAEMGRRIVEDYIYSLREESGGEGVPPINDNLGVYVGSILHHNISIFEGNLLKATSMRELYSAGILEPWVSGEVYRRIVYERARTVSTRRVSGGLIYLDVSIPLLEGSVPPKILSLETALEESAILHEVGDFDQVIYVSVFAVALAASFLAISLAGRIARPIRKLTEGTGKLARGDFEFRIATSSRDEIRSLVDSFNRMAGDLKSQQETLVQRKEYIEKILENAAAGVISVDVNGIVTTINRAAARLFGVPAPAVVGKDLGHFLDSVPCLQPLADCYRQFRREEGRKEELEVQVRPEGGEDMTLRTVLVPFYGAGGRIMGVILILEDITELIRSNRLRAWAEMARRFAHEVKNPLTPIQLAVGHLRKVFEDGAGNFGEVMQTCTATIMNQVTALRKIAGEFSSYAKRPVLELEDTNLADFLREVVSPYSSFPPPNVRFEVEFADGLPTVRIDRERMKRVVINLIENSLQAMEKGGTMTVRAAEVAAGGKRRLELTVRDTGCGLSEEARERLFEPYFSTKSSGVGLGLTIARQTVEEHGGELHAEQPPEGGTLMRVLLPVNG
jgi:PAS domain S-box-containing protein